MTDSLPKAEKKQHYRRYTALEKQRFVEETYQLGNSVSAVARQYGITPSLLYQWRRLMEEGALTSIDSKEGVVDKHQVKKLESRIRQLERALGRSQLDNEILREAVKLAREKKLISRQPLPGIEDLE